MEGAQGSRHHNGNHRPKYELRAQQEVKTQAKRQMEAIGLHDNQPNKMDAMDQHKVKVPAEGFIPAERAKGQVVSW